MRVKKQQLKPCMEQLIGSRLRKEYNRAVCCHPVCLTYMWSTYVGWMSYKLGIKIGGKKNNLRYVDDNTVMVESKEELRRPLMRVK